MKSEVGLAIEELKRHFSSSVVDFQDDGSGGAFVVIESVDLGERYKPRKTWLGAHIPPLYPYADIYPVFMGADVRRADGAEFSAPVTCGASFRGRPAIQISRRNNLAGQTLQTAVGKLLKILKFLETLP
ncbi:hypothetical protein [Aestuariivirga sp.]|uniref:hypothetical protein n=1 Tax=Aestuariivirga sp. TaxID=2650926 RepID=UPI0039E54B3C